MIQRLKNWLITVLHRYIKLFKKPRYFYRGTPLYESNIVPDGEIWAYGKNGKKIVIKLPIKPKRARKKK